MSEPQRDELSKFAGKIRLDAICDRFESLWMSGQRPSMEKLLLEASEAERGELFEHLLSLELEYRLREQEQPTAGEYLATYPCYGPQIEKAFSELKKSTQKGADSSESLLPQAQLQPNPGESPTLNHGFPANLGPGTHIRYLGDYELLEELGRGGMGVVCKARQLSLNRLVAVKMILAGVLATEADVQRFHAEAEAAAGLDHPGIVPVFEVGQYSGYHYFSMGYVEGQSLSRRIAESPLPPREAARIMAQVAEAVEYAHSKGVIHRDLKPANVLLDPTSQARVTDFGLAKRLDQESSLSISGTLVGTPSYMPPEQASGQVKRVDIRSDVYSLGATLYAMLSGRPPFQADNWSDTCLQVVHQEPIPPRQLNPKLPRDLETVCLKCLEKDPRRRYASARELADELGRYLRGEPIHARPIGRPERLWRWCRRNPIVAVLSASIALLLVLGTLVSTYYAVAATNSAREATKARSLAEKEKDRATGNFKMASEAVKTFYTQVADDPRLAPHGLEDLRRSLLESANKFYEKLINQESSDSGMQHERLEALFSRGNIERALNNRSQAENAYKNTIATANQLIQAHGSDSDYRYFVAGSHQNLGMIYRASGKLQQAKTEFKKAIDMWMEMVKEHPNEHNYQQALGGSYCDLGTACSDAGESAGAENAYTAAVDVLERVTKVHPDMLTSQLFLATSQSNLGNMHAKMGRAAAAESAHGKAVAIFEMLAAKDPKEPRYQDRLAAAYGNLALIYESAGQAEKQESVLLKSLKIREVLAREHPAVPSYKADLALVNNSLGIMYYNAKRIEKAKECDEKALVLWQDLAAGDTTAPEYQNGMASSYRDLGTVYQEGRQYEKAEEAYKKAIAREAALAEEHRDVPQYRVLLAQVYNCLGYLYRDMDKPKKKEAEAAYSQALAIRKALAQEHPNDRNRQNDLAISLYNWGNVCCDARRTKEAETSHREALAIRRTLAEKYPAVPEYQINLAFSQYVLARLLKSAGQTNEAKSSYRDAIATWTTLLEKYPQASGYRSFLEKCRTDLQRLASPPKATQKPLGGDAKGADKTKEAAPRQNRS
jgi:eukaryotic-like serine/threonine-protein kinase